MKTERLDVDAPAGGLELCEAHLTVVDGPALGREVACGTRAVSIGSAPGNDLVVPDGAVSRQHARLEPSGGRLLLIDLSSTNGTFVGGVRVQSVFVQPGDLIRVGKTLLALRVKARSAVVPLHAGDRFGGLAGTSAALRQLFTLLEWVAPTQISVLISGPSGSGKEAAARALHEAQPRSGPFVAVAGAALEPAAFRDAQGGTLFVDEVADLPLERQPAVMRVLEARQLDGAALDLRVAASTRHDLAERVSRGAFREDLYYQLGQVRVAIPALAERREDIPLLVAAFLAARPEAARPTGVAPDCLAFLSQAAWPGNVRQLRSLVDRAAQLAPRRVIAMADLLLTPAEHAALTGAAAAPAGASAPVPARKPSRRETLIATLEAHDWNLTHTARALRMALNTLKSRMEKEGIPRRRP